MEKGGGHPATRAAGGMCDRFLTFLARNLTMSRPKSVTEGPTSGAGGGAQAEDGAGEDEFSIQIERAEFDLEFGGDGHDSSVVVATTTILEDSSAAAAATDEEQKKGAAIAAASAAASAAGGPPVAAAEAAETTKVRKTVTIKEDRPQEGGGGAAGTVERKRFLFRKRQASSAGAAAGDEPRAPKRSGLRPRMPAVPRVPSNVNERSSTFIEERRKSFTGSGKPPPAAPEK